MRLGRILERLRLLEHQRALVIELLHHLDVLGGDSGDIADVGRALSVVKGCYDRGATAAALAGVKRILGEIRDNFSTEMKRIDRIEANYGKKGRKK